jgi:predicted  nucleic acid-binding Zn-ribbon protein
LTQVRCLECGAAYAKPAKGGTVEQNPGCPRCGYIGWIPAAVEAIPGEARSRSAADLLQRRASRRH